MFVSRRLLAALLFAGFAPGVAGAEEPPAFPPPFLPDVTATAAPSPSPSPAPAAAPAEAVPDPTAYLADLSQRALNHRLYESKRWLYLLHARPDGAGGYESEVDGKKFFLAKDGKKSPRAEMLATLAAFVTPPKDAKELPACRFLARWKFLDEELHFDPHQLPAPSCPEYLDWKNEVNAGSVTLVFASAFIGSPASTYGHTFLRIDKKGIDSPLLALAVEFAANPTTFNPILYSIYGLAGGFEGHFFSRPYFSKVQEYSNLEARDLWEYRLKLDDDQIDWLIRHLWEL
ncbi:MAG TPA: DUF4105 domain-containing protein, partial [bacterium]|nr:DUF4105 domain-containing protein [bacterium]